MVLFCLVFFNYNSYIQLFTANKRQKKNQRKCGVLKYLADYGH